MTQPPADRTARCPCAGSGPRAPPLRSEIRERDLKISCDENGVLCGYVLEAVARVSVASRDEEHAAERFIALAALAGHPEPAQTQRLVEPREHHRATIAES